MKIFSSTSIKRLLWAQFFGMLILFHCLPDYFGGCGMGCHPGISYGWPYPSCHHFYGVGNTDLTAAIIAAPKGGWEWASLLGLSVSLLIQFACVIVFLFLLRVLAKKTLLQWSRKQLVFFSVCSLLIVLLNVYMTFFRYDDFNELKQSQGREWVNARGWPIPKMILHESPQMKNLPRQATAFKNLAMFNLPLAWLLPLVLTLSLTLLRKKREIPDVD